MSQKAVEQMQAIFQTNNKLILRQWKRIYPNKQSKLITIQQLSIFVKNVFQVSKDQLQMEIDPDTDYKEMIHDYLQNTEQQNKYQFTYEQAVQMLNWAVEPQNDEQQNNETQQINQNSKNQQEKSQKEQENLLLQNLNNKEIQQPQLQQKSISNQIQQKENISQIQHNNNQQPKKSSSKQDLTLKQSQNQQKIEQKQIDIKQIIGYQQESLYQKQNISPSKRQNSQHNQNYLDWGQNYDQDKKKIKLYQSINSIHPSQTQTNSIKQLETILSPTLKKTISIKKSLAKINLTKQKPKINQKKILQISFDDPNAPQLKYIKKQKIIIKNKLPKPQFKPQIMGLKQLFKFYCSLHSEHSHKKAIDPQKATFDQIKSKISQLYMHNFMLLCKDFSIVESRKPQNPLKIKVSTVNEPQDIDGNQQHNKTTQRKQKESIAQGLSERKEKVHKIFKRNRGYVKQDSDIWDRDRLCGYFKKEADYSLKVKYDMFVEIMKYVLRDRITVETQAQQIFDEGGDNNDEQNLNSQSNHRIDPVVLAICQYFKVDTQQNFKQTMNRLRIQYKMIEADSLQAKNQQKKINGQLNGFFQKSIQQKLKIRQKEKQQQRIQVKQKYFNKYSSPDNDIYSSFRAAKNQTNSANSIYGSAPKLTPLNLNNSHQVSTKRSDSSNKDSDMFLLRKNISKNYNSSSQIGTILKEARRQIMQEKQNPLNSKNQTFRLAKSKFNPFQTQKQKIQNKIPHESNKLKEEDTTVSLILVNRSRLIQENPTKRSQKIKNKSKDINSLLLERIGCDDEQDELLDKFLDQQKLMQRPLHGVIY